MGELFLVTLCNQKEACLQCLLRLKIKGARRAISLIRKYIRFHLVEVSVNVKN